MNRRTALKSLAPVLALVAGIALATPASAIGGPPGGFVLPPGSTATFSGIDFGACNNLGWGYSLNFGPDQVQATRQGNCVTHMPAPDVTIGPFATPTNVRVFLKDITCTATYYSDGTPVDHVIISGSNPYLLRFSDAGGFCERQFITANDFTLYNLKLTLTITDLCKVEDMNSNLDLVCEQEGQHGDSHVGDDSAGNGNHGDSSVETLKATPVERESTVKVSVKVTAKVSAGKVEHANHTGGQAQQSQASGNSDS
jgi:hypothetical protein